MKSRTPITIAVILGSAVLVYVAYIYVFQPGMAPSGTLSQSGAINPSAPTGRNSFLEIIVNLRSLALDGSLFTDPAFQSLQDFGVNLESQPKGRPNPFAPLGVNAAASSQASAQTGARAQTPPAGAPAPAR